MPKCKQCGHTNGDDVSHCGNCGEPIIGPVMEELLWLLEQGRKIEAIKVYREATGAGLKDAKDVVDALDAKLTGGANTVAAGGDLEAKLLSLLQQGQKIAAIKLYREHKDVGLKAAKEAVEALAAEHGVAAPKGAGCAGMLLLLATVAWTAAEFIP